MRRSWWGAIATPLVAVAGLALLYTTVDWWPGILLVGALAAGTELIIRSW